MRLDRDEFAVSFDPSRITSQDLIQTIEAAGYHARIVRAATVQAPTPAAGVPTDLEPLAAALREAQQQQKPLLLYFHAGWCSPCQRMERETFTDPGVVVLLRRYVLLNVDTDEHIQLSRAFGVTGIPDVRLLSLDGQRQQQLPGFQTAAAMAQTLQTFLDQGPRWSPAPDVVPADGEESEGSAGAETVDRPRP